MGCEVCKLRLKAEAKPRSLLARLWRWHTTWCPGWKKYQASLAAGKAASPGIGGTGSSGSAAR